MNKYTYTLFLTLSVLFFAISFSSSPGDFSYWDLGYILISFAICVSIQIVIVHWLRSRYIFAKILLGLFLLANMLALYLSMSSQFTSLPVWQHMIAFAVAAWVFYVLISAIENNPLVGVFGTLATVLAVLVLVAPVIMASGMKLQKDLRNIEALDSYIFKDRPNIYMISFDALISRDIASKLLRADNQEYHDVLDEFLHPFKNFFSVGLDTRKSLNGHLAFSRDYYERLQNEGVQFELYSGHEPSPLFEKFRRNGYQSTTFHESSYLGKSKGPHIDRYEINRHLTACAFVRGTYRRLTFFGICQHKPRLLAEYIIRNLLSEPKRSEGDFAINTIKKAIEMEKPQIVLGYIHSPGHAPLDFSYFDSDKLDAYRKAFEFNSKRTARILRRIITFLQTNDPTGVMLVFGDHGPFLSKGARWVADLNFRFADEYAVYGGIYPKTFCPERLLDRSDVPFTTSVSAAEEIILCLSGFDRETRAQTPSVPFDKEPSLEENQYEAHLYQ